jgi:hypothetical protein
MLLLDGDHSADCASRSWCGALDAATVQSAPQLGEECVEATVHVKGGWEGEQASDLLCGEIIDEAELEHEQVARREVGQRPSQRVVQLGISQWRIRLVVLGRRGLVQLELLGDEILQATARATRIGDVVARRPTVAPAIEIEADPPRDDDEPGRHATAGIARELAQSAMIVGAQMVEYVRIRIHRVVVRVPDRTTGVQYDATVLRDEGAPRRIRVRDRLCLEQRRQRAGEGDHRKTIVGHGE